MGELFFMAIGPVTLGLLMFAFGLYGERTGTIKPWIKWMALVPLLFGLVFGWDYFKKVTGTEGEAFVLLNMIDRKKYLYQASFVLPLIALLILPVWAFLAKRKAAEEDYYDEEALLDEAAEDAGYEEEAYIDEEHEEIVEEDLLEEEHEEELIHEEHVEDEPGRG